MADVAMPCAWLPSAAGSESTALSQDGGLFGYEEPAPCQCCSHHSWPVTPAASEYAFDYSSLLPGASDGQYALAPTSRSLGSGAPAPGRASAPDLVLSHGACDDFAWVATELTAEPSTYDSSLLSSVHTLSPTPATNFSPSASEEVHSQAGAWPAPTPFECASSADPAQEMYTMHNGTYFPCPALSDVRTRAEDPSAADLASSRERTFALTTSKLPSRAYSACDCGSADCPSAYEETAAYEPEYPCQHSGRHELETTADRYRGLGDHHSGLGLGIALTHNATWPMRTTAGKRPRLDEPFVDTAPQSTFVLPNSTTSRGSNGHYDPQMYSEQSYPSAPVVRRGSSHRVARVLTYGTAPAATSVARGRGRYEMLPRDSARHSRARRPVLPPSPSNGVVLKTFALPASPQSAKASPNLAKGARRSVEGPTNHFQPYRGNSAPVTPVIKSTPRFAPFVDTHQVYKIPPPSAKTLSTAGPHQLLSPISPETEGQRADKGGAVVSNVSGQTFAFAPLPRRSSGTSQRSSTTASTVPASETTTPPVYATDDDEEDGEGDDDAFDTDGDYIVAPRSSPRRATRAALKQAPDSPRPITPTSPPPLPRATTTPSNKSANGDRIEIAPPRRKRDRQGVSQEVVKRFKCEYDECDKRFIRLEHLKRHERSHTQVKPYDCEVCGKTFTRSDNRAAHRKTHDKPTNARAMPPLKRKLGA